MREGERENRTRERIESKNTHRTEADRDYIESNEVVVNRERENRNREKEERIEGGNTGKDKEGE